jgi:hypothetical protein
VILVVSKGAQKAKHGLQVEKGKLKEERDGLSTDQRSIVREWVKGQTMLKEVKELGDLLIWLS